MKIKTIAAGVLTLGMLAMPFVSGAAFTMTSTALTVDGKTVVTEDPGASVNMTVHGQLSGTGNGSQIQSVMVSFPGTQVGDGNIYDVDDVQIAGSRYVVIPNVVLPNISTGGNIAVKIAFFDNAAHNNQEADGTPFTTKTFTGVIHLRSAASGVVTTVTPGSGTGAPANSLLEQLQAAVAALAAKLEAFTSGGTKPAYCADLMAKIHNMVMVYAYNSANIPAQQALVAAGFMTQEQLNTGPGWYGSRTSSAVTQATLMCSK